MGWCLFPKPLNKNFEFLVFFFLSLIIWDLDEVASGMTSNQLNMFIDCMDSISKSGSRIRILNYVSFLSNQEGELSILLSQFLQFLNMINMFVSLEWQLGV